MRRLLFVIAAFAAVGFGVSWALLGYSAYAFSHHFVPNSEVFLWFCPPSIMAMALDNVSAAEGVLGWLVIALCNAVLYAIAGVVVGCCVIGWPRKQ